MLVRLTKNALYRISGMKPESYQTTTDDGTKPESVLAAYNGIARVTGDFCFLFTLEKGNLAIPMHSFDKYQVERLEEPCRLLQ